MRCVPGCRREASEEELSLSRSSERARPSVSALRVSAMRGHVRRTGEKEETGPCSRKTNASPLDAQNNRHYFGAGGLFSVVECSSRRGQMPN